MTEAEIKKIRAEIESEFRSKQETLFDELQQTKRQVNDAYYKVECATRQWTCPNCGTVHDRDGNAAMNIRAEGLRMLQTGGTPVSADGGDVRPKGGRRGVVTTPVLLRQSPGSSREAPPSSLDRAG